MKLFTGISALLKWYNLSMNMAQLTIEHKRIRYISGPPLSKISVMDFPFCGCRNILIYGFCVLFLSYQLPYLHL
ncbi:MAG: hypothetical protein ACD_79C00386G0001 [uncultured bacterium]|nr:MAG: hypothetical protein ACD_79C00386G0001 [uncultured bacterium]